MRSKKSMLAAAFLLASAYQTYSLPEPRKIQPKTREERRKQHERNAKRKRRRK